MSPLPDLGPAPLEELRDTVLAAARDEHAGRDGQSLTIGKEHPLAACSADGPVLRVPDTPENRAVFGSVGTADDSAAWPSVRLYPLSNCLTRSLLAMPWGPAGSDKTASEQGLLDQVMRDYPHVLSKDQVWLPGRLWHGVRRLRELAGLTHFAARLKSDIRLEKISEIYPDHSYLAEVCGDGVTMTVRVTGYDVAVEGQDVPEMFSPISWTGKSTPAPGSPRSINGGGTDPRRGCGRPSRPCTVPGRAPGRCSAPAAPS